MQYAVGRNGKPLAQMISVSNGEPRHVHLGSLANFRARITDVGFTAKSGHGVLWKGSPSQASELRFEVHTLFTASFYNRFAPAPQWRKNQLVDDLLDVSCSWECRTSGVWFTRSSPQVIGHNMTETEFVSRFQREPTGSWTCTKPIKIDGQKDPVHHTRTKLQPRRLIPGNRVGQRA